MQGGSAQRQFEHLCRTAAVGLALLDDELLFVRANDAFALMIGESLDAIPGRPLAEVSLIAEQAADRCREVLADGQPRRAVEMRMPASSGGAVWLVDFHPCLIEESRGVSLAVQDVTAIRRAEQLLDERLRFETLLSDMSAEFIQLDEKELDKAFNVNLERIVVALEIDRASLLEFSPRQKKLRLTHTWSREGLPSMPAELDVESLPWFLDKLLNARPLIFRSLDDFPPEATAERALTEALHAKSGVAVPLIADGRLLGVVSFSTLRKERDWSLELISRVRLLGEIFASAMIRKRTIAALMDSEQRYRTLIEHAPETIMILDLDTERFADINDKGLELFKIDRADLSNVRLTALCPLRQPDGRDSAEAALAYCERALAGETPKFEWVHCDTSGREFLCEVSLVAVPSSSGRLVRGSVADISARKELEEQLHQSRKMEAIGHLAGGVAHDFNNLLTAIHGNVEMAMSKIEERDPLNRYLGEIRDAGKRAAALTGQLLAFGRRQMIQPRVLSLNEVVDNLTRMLERVIGEHVKLITVLEPSIGRVEADPHQIEQIVVNLAINARDAMPGGGTLTVVTGSRDLQPGDGPPEFEPVPGRYVALEVRDTGTGIDPDLRARIFEPFFTTKERGRGTGLGLATVYGIVKQNGGYIQMDSDVGAGTRFTVCLPASDKVVEQIAPAQTDASPGSETILLVEDEDIVREVAKRSLHKYGYNVLEAGDADEALILAANHPGPIDLLLTDVVMPGMGGHELARELEDERPETDVLFVSGYTDDQIARHGVLEEGVEFLSKPYSPSTLARKVREVLDKSRQESA